MRPDKSIASYKVRWREEDPDGVPRNASKSFSLRKLGSADRALAAASAFRKQAVAAAQLDGSVQRADPAAAMTVGELFQEWCVKHVAGLSKAYGEKVVRMWDNEIENRSIAQVRLGRLSRDPALIVRFQDAIAAEGMRASKRVEVLKLLRAVLRWGRRRHPNALSVELSGLFEMPKRRTGHLAYAADAYGLERIIEAVLGRANRDALVPLRDGAFVAAMGFTVAARPSEWLYSACWGDVLEGSVELQRPGREVDESSALGLKTGARAALLLPNAYERLMTYREALEDRYGPQPDEALVFQVLGPDGPVWSQEGRRRIPTPWDYDDYKHFAARVFRPARAIAAKAPGVPAGLETMRFYDCRHTAISMAMHSTLVAGSHGMNLHNLAGWAGHDVQTLQRYYSHIIVRYQGKKPIDLKRECKRARARVEAKPFKPPKKTPGPQREAHRRRRSRAANAPPVPR